jgi:hypothetical protein
MVDLDVVDTILRTYYKAFHFVFPFHFHAQSFRYLVIVLESTTTCRHDAQVFWCRAIVLFVVGLQLAHKLNACIYPVCLELEEVQSATNRIVARFAREVYKLCE